MTDIIRLCKREDVPVLMRMFETVYPANPLLQRETYFNWQFRNTPFQEGEGYQLYILEDDGKIRGFLGFNPVGFRFGDSVLKGCWTYTWYAAERDGSGLKLLTRLMADYDYRFYVGLSNDSQAVYAMYKIPLLKEMPRWVGVLDPKTAADLFKITDSGSVKLFGESAEYLSRSETSGPDGGVMGCRRFDDGEEFFFDSWPGITGYVQRTGSYLNWRYADIPFHDYRMIRNDAGGFGVYRVETVMGTEHRVMRILEWNFKDVAAEKAMAYLVREGLNEGAVIMDFFCTASVVGEELIRLGFFNENKVTPKIPYLFRPLYRTDGISLAIDLPPHRRTRTVDFGAWYITKGDSDIDRMKI